MRPSFYWRSWSEIDRLEKVSRNSNVFSPRRRSRADSGNAERIMLDISPKQLIEVACSLFHQNANLSSDVDVSNSSQFFDASSLSGSAESDEDDEYEVTPKEVTKRCDQTTMY